MDIAEFFQLSSGKWFSQRTSHDFALKKSESGKSTVEVELLDKADPAVIKLCEQNETNADLAVCGARLTWQGTTESSKKEQTGSTFLVAIADAPNAAEGRLLRQRDHADPAPIAGRYLIGSDESVTLIAESTDLYSEDRLWFASPNLRFRTTVLKRSGGFTMATFCSEIRMGVTKPPQPAPIAGTPPTDNQ